MKTATLIIILTDAINAVNESNDLVAHMELVDEKIPHSIGEMWTAAHSLQSAPCSVFRALWKELPEDLKTEEGDELVKVLYPHLYDEDYMKMRTICHQLHAIVYEMWNEMRDARDKFGFK